MPALVGERVALATTSAAQDSPKKLFFRVSLRDIRPDLTCKPRSADCGRLGHVAGSDLITHGLEILDAPQSGAQVLVLEPTNQLASLHRR